MNIAVLRRRWSPYREALISRITTRPDATRRDLIDNTCALLWRGARSGDNFFEGMDNLYLCGADSQSSCLNWINPLWTLVPTNTPTFTTDRGFSGDAVSQHVTWGGCSWFTAPSQNQRDNGLIWTYETSDVNDATFAIGNSGSGTASFIRGRNAGNCEGRCSAGNTATFAQAASTGLTLVNRVSSVTHQLYRGNTQIFTNGTHTSADPGTTSICFLRNNVTYSTRRVGGGGKGHVLTGQGIIDFNTAIAFWMAGVGA